MDTVTDARLAVALAHEGGIGIIHRFMSIEEEAAEVARVKRPEEVVVRDVHTTSPNRTIRDASLQMARSEVSSLLVVDRERQPARHPDHPRPALRGEPGSTRSPR